MKALCSHAKHYKENFHMVVLCSISIQLHKEYFGAPLADFNEASTIWWHFLINILQEKKITKKFEPSKF
jgi:hypothetical protein